MNAMSNSDDYEINYRSREKEEEGQSNGPPSRARRSKHGGKKPVKAPSQFNGIHRRRKKRMSW